MITFHVTLFHEGFLPKHYLGQYYRGRIFSVGPGLRLYASRRPVRPLVRGAYEFCRRISIPDGQ
jgi:hypothetical protein